MGDESAPRSITPDTRVAALLKEFPELEETLISMSPEFAKLRNPVLRKTVARVATLRQAAAIGDISLGEMINTLREEAGLQPVTPEELEKDAHSQEKPIWVDERTTTASLDARSMLESGGNPLSQVLEKLKNLNPGSKYELITPFLPAPLIDIVRKKGFETWTEQENTELFRTYIGHT
jgi:uncharacterized protein (DUF2249 family)